MLPSPATSRHGQKDKPYFRSFQTAGQSSLAPNGLFAQLRARTRLTNLAVLLLTGGLCLSLLLNTTYLFASPRLRPPRIPNVEAWSELASAAQLDSGIPLSIETTIERDGRYADLDHMIMVPGHAIWIGHDPDKIDLDDEWVLESMQKGGSVRTYVHHIRESVRLLQADPRALLVFSGGATRHPPSPPLPEAVSYHSLAHALGLLPSTPIPETNGIVPLPLNLRAATEEYALDSYENLLFSIARFHEVTARWPAKITVVGYGMKQKRFEQLHRQAIGWPSSRFQYVGIDDEGDTTEQYAGELKYGYTPFLSSPSGCHPPLSIKRLMRNPYIRYHPYHTSSPELGDLLEWCPPYHIVDEGAKSDEAWKSVPTFEGDLPWRDGRTGGTRWGREQD